MAMRMETLMMKAAAAKAARIQRTLERYGVQATATSASSSDASNTAGGKAVTVISVSWSVHEHARNASGESGVAMRSAAATAAGLSAIESERLERYVRLRQLRSLCHWCPGVGRYASLKKDYRTTAQRQKLTETGKRQGRHDARRVRDRGRTCASIGVSRVQL
eukprot:3614193-Pleurochrysis_carterae.AAC.2